MITELQSEHTVAYNKEHAGGDPELPRGRHDSCPGGTSSQGSGRLVLAQPVSEVDAG